MSDKELRDIERQLKATGQSEDRECRERLARALLRTGYNNDSQRVINAGLPWVEFNPSDAPNTVRFYNVMHKSFGDETRTPYVFTWDKELFRHPDRNQEINGQDYFSQERLVSILAREGMQKRPPTASAVHSHVLTLEEITRLNLQPEEARKARNFLKQHIAEWPLTWTMIDCDKPAVIQDYDLQEQRTEVDIRGANHYLSNLNTEENMAGDLIKNVILRAEQTVEEIDRMYNNLLSVNNSAYAWRPNNNTTGKRAVVLGRNVFSIRFYINCNDVIDGRSARLVVTQNAKDFLGGNECRIE